MNLCNEWHAIRCSVSVSALYRAKTFRRFAPGAAAVALILFFGGPARAVVLDWSSATWTPGSLSNSFDVDPSAPGNDVTVSLGGDTSIVAVDPASGLQTPAITQSLQGGLTPVPYTLMIYTDSTRPTDQLTITINFSAAYNLGVTNVTFSIFDIDKNSYHDRISNIYATSTDGTTQFAPTITNVGSSVNLSGNGLNQTLTGSADSPDTGAGSGAGNATISFTQWGVRSVTFTFDNSAAFPSPQSIGIYNISFTPVPEINPAFSGPASCAFAAVLTLHLRRRARRTASEYAAEPSQSGSRGRG